MIRTGILCVPVQDGNAVDAVVELLRTAIVGVVIIQQSAALSQRHWIEEILRGWCDEEELDLVVTIGGTFPALGTSPDEIVPDATMAVIERALPGLAEAMRSYAAQESPLAWLDRSVVGVRGRSLIVNLPAEAAPAILFLEAIRDLLAPLLAFLQGGPAIRLSDHLELYPLSSSELSMDSTLEPKPQKGLDAAEFAAFLQRPH